MKVSLHGFLVTQCTGLAKAKKKQNFFVYPAVKIQKIQASWLFHSVAVRLNVRLSVSLKLFKFNR